MKYSFLVLLFSLGSTAFATESYEYKCYSYFWNGYDDVKATMDLTVSSRRASGQVIENGHKWDESVGGSLNPRYRSRGRTKFVKFGAELILEESLTTGGQKLRDGKLGGIARIEGEAEGGFYQYKFICKQEE